MRFKLIRAIVVKEILDMVRDRRTLISMVAVPLLILPVIFGVMSRVIETVEKRSEAEAKTLGVALHVITPGLRESLASAGLVLNDKDDPRAAVEQKHAATGLIEHAGGSGPNTLEIIVDSSNPTSSAAGDKLRVAVSDYKDQRVRESLRSSGVAETVLTPFTIKRTNVAGMRKMAGATWGSMLGYLLLLLMFTGGMYPIIDMTAGEKERRTLEAFLCSPANRKEIAFGKIFAGMIAILLTAGLTLTSVVFSVRNNRIGGRSPEMRAMFETIPLDAGTIALIGLALLPLAAFAAAGMFAIALFARSFKEGQSYLTPLTIFVIFPALMGGMPGLELTPVLALIPIFNASQLIRGILLGEFSQSAFVVMTVANFVYAGIAFLIAARTFEDETVLFRS